ncbi:MAG TPA: ornithine carbamoyltransferase [Clostridia bacterium]|nr:ornithine carbamoyltransferase [Clostridia bacterium]
MKGKDLLSIYDLSLEEINLIFRVAEELKSDRKIGKPHPYLQGKTLAMIFQKHSTRTRVSFEVGMYQLGGYALYLSGKDLQLGRGETIKDTAQVLSRYVDGIMIRTFSHEEVEELAYYASVPVINGLTDLLHPCQVLADLFTIKEKKGSLKGLKLAFIGDGNNVAHSLLYGCSKVGMDIAVASPPGYKVKEEIVERAMAVAKKTGSKILITEDPLEAAKDADVLYTDVWASMGQEEEQEERMKMFSNYQVNKEMLKYTKEDPIFLHCLPAHRGEEVTEEIIDGPWSAVFDEAENRLHVQKAIMALLMS